METKKLDLRRVGEGFVEKAVDAVLLAVYFNLEFPSLARSRRNEIEGKVQEDFENFNYQTLKRAYLHLKEKGLVQTLKETEALPKITQAGERRLRSLIPFYSEERVWDGRLYLVSYDMPVRRNKERDYLRNYLKAIGCGMLQQSVWLTPYNPTVLLKQFVQEHNLSESLVLVSSIGKNGAVGGMTRTDLMERVYHLSSLDQRYREFVFTCKHGKETRRDLILWFLSILKDDPQIPFPLLSGDWVGDKAYRLFKTLTPR